MKQLLFSILLVLPLFMVGQRYSQSTGAFLEIELTDNNGVKVKSTSRDIKLEFAQDKSGVKASMDFETLESSNFQFLELIRRSDLDGLEVIVPLQDQDYWYQSAQNKQATLDARILLNGYESIVPLSLNFSNIKTNDQNTFSVVAMGTFELSDFDLQEFLPKYEDLGEFQFTVTLREIYR